MPISATPHHDGSPAFVQPGPYAAGDLVPVRLRVPHEVSAQAVWLRTNRDGEPRITPARLDRTGLGEDEYLAEVLIHNPSNAYRFLIETPTSASGYLWVDGVGAHEHDIADTHDFRLLTANAAPEWLREGLVYQIFPDRFARSAQADDRAVPRWAVPMAWDAEPAEASKLAGKQFYGGDLLGVQEHLDHIVSLGAGTIYLTPMFPGQTSHRYDASTFHQIDPLLGGDNALAELADAAHARGLRLMGDLTTNHTGRSHEWFQAARDPASPERGMYLFAEESGSSAPDVVRDPAGEYVGWLGRSLLPKLDWRSPELWRRMVDDEDAALVRWLRQPGGLDGWRIDVANMTGKYGATDLGVEVARRIRRRLSEVRPDSALFAESFYDFTADLDGTGWHGAMNYTGFSRPVWNWLADPEADLRFVSVPVRRRPVSGALSARTMRDFAARVPWQIASTQWNILGSHDTPRLRTVVGSGERVELAAALLFAYPGTPFLYAGDEIGAQGRDGESGRVTMPWDQLAGGPRWDQTTLRVFKGLSRLRNAESALREGGIRWLVQADDALVFLRESQSQRVLVAISRAPWSGATLPRWVLSGPADRIQPQLLYQPSQVATPTLVVQGDQVALSGDGPGIGVWQVA